MKIGVISDTHSVLQDEMYEFFKDCCEIWHAGDIGSVEVLHKLENFKPLRGVYGNIDSYDIRIQLKESQFFETGCLKILVTHIGGKPAKYNSKSNALIKQFKPDIFVCGHSHILKIMHDKDNKLLYINPGAAGNYGIHKIITFLKFDIENGHLLNMEVYNKKR